MTLAEYAVALALPAFPCAADKRPVTAHGLHDASSDPARIRAMFAHPAAALIGVPTGTVSGLVAIDIDVGGGKRGAEWLRAHRETVPPTRVHRTQSGGFHILFSSPGIEIRNSAGRLGLGVDVRGRGGYIVHPPSPGYTVARDLPVAAMPEWLIDACRPPRRSPAPPRPVLRDGNDGGARALRFAYGTVSSAREGGRNDALNSVAYWLARLAADGVVVLADAAAVLLAAAGQAGLPIPETQATIRSAFSAGTGRPGIRP